MRDGGTGAKVSTAQDAVDVINNADLGNFDKSPRERVGLEPVPNVAGFPLGVFNDPSIMVRLFLCRAGAEAIQPDNARLFRYAIGAILCLGEGRIAIKREAANIADAPIVEIHPVKSGYRFNALSADGPKRIVAVLKTVRVDGGREIEGTTLQPDQIIGLPCGAISSISKRAGHKTIAQTIRALQGEGKFKCFACGGTQLEPYSEPEGPQPTPSVLWSLADAMQDWGGLPVRA